MAEAGGEPGAGLGPVLAVGLKAMVDMQDQQRPPGLPRPVIGHQCQRDGVSPARETDSHRGAVMAQKSAIKDLADRSL